MTDLQQRVAQARQACDAASQVAIPRPESQNLFPGETGLPEITGPQLNREKLAAGLLHHGALIVRGLYDAQQLRLLTDTARRDELANKEDNSPLGCCASTWETLLSVYRDCGLLDTLRDYLDGTPMLFAERAKLRHHRDGVDNYAAIPWHQDMSFFGRQSYAVNCWAAVTECGAGNPGLSIVPVRNEALYGWKEEDGLAPLTYGKGMSDDQIDTVCYGRAVASPVLAPGDAILFDEMTLHQTALRPWSQESQIVTISWFFRASGFPDWGSPLAL